MPHITRIVIALDQNGAHKGSAVYEAEVVAGRVFDLDPRPIAAGDAAGLAAVMSTAQAAALVSLDAKDAQISTLASERDTAQATAQTQAARIAELEAQLAAVQPGATGADEVPFRFGAAALLLSGWFGPQVTTPDHLNAAVEAFLANLPGLTAEQRALAIFTWRRSATIRKSNPLVSMVAAALGKTQADIDALFAQAEAWEQAELAAG